MEERGFTYNVNNDIQYRQIPGRFNAVVQLNSNRLKKRNRSVPFQSLKDPFDHDAFNFFKIQQNEVVLIKFK